MIFDECEGPPSKEEREGAKHDAEEYLQLWRKRALYATVAFFLSCASVSPFLYGRPLHAYWESFGKYLLLLTMALLIPFVACGDSNEFVVLPEELEERQAVITDGTFGSRVCQLDTDRNPHQSRGERSAFSGRAVKSLTLPRFTTA
jgi:hypothetical protein